MTELARLLVASNKTERACARRLAAAALMTHEQALRATLLERAGDAGLAHLLAGRDALRAFEAARLAARNARQGAALARRQARHDGEPTPWRAWFDGSARPNPGRCGIGGLVRGPGGLQVEISQPAGTGNSSEAEYRALLAVLEAAVGIGAGGPAGASTGSTGPTGLTGLTVYGDSQVVVADVNGLPQAGAPALRAYRERAHALIAQLGAVTVRWLPRHKNGEADALSRRASALASNVDPDGAG